MSIGKKYNHWIVEQMAIAGAMNADVLRDPDQAAAAAGYVATRLNGLSPETERGWSGEPIADGGLQFTRELRGVKETHVIDGRLVVSAEARQLDRMAAELQAVYAHPAVLRLGDRELPVNSPTQLLEAVVETGKRGLTLQRYKGLGEMNPDQLWVTTLDPSVRTLLQVKINHTEEADSIFSTLMGDVVEPRREFIQENALDVANLDV